MQPPSISSGKVGPSIQRCHLRREESVAWDDNRLEQHALAVLVPSAWEQRSPQTQGIPDTKH